MSPDACSVQGPEPGAEATGVSQVQGKGHTADNWNSVHRHVDPGEDMNSLSGDVRGFLGVTRVQCEGGRISQAQNGE